jgi:hypothetical protein
VLEHNESKNCRAHSTLAMRSPYEVVFFREPKFGTCSSKLPEKLREALAEGNVPLEEDIYGDELSSSTEDTERNALLQLRSSQVGSVNVAQEKLADLMTDRASRLLVNPVVGDCVALGVDKVDRGPLDPNSIVCTVLEIRENGFVLGCSFGVLEHIFQKNTFVLLKERHLAISDVPNNIVNSICTAMKHLSTFGGQGFLRCTCTGDCKTKRCKCVKEKAACNSRCRPGRSCANNEPYPDCSD